MSIIIVVSASFQDPSVCFVISSDFCHWGNRFNFTHYDSSAGEIHQSIAVRTSKLVAMATMLGWSR